MPYVFFFLIKGTIPRSNEKKHLEKYLEKILNDFGRINKLRKTIV